MKHAVYQLMRKELRRSKSGREALCRNQNATDQEVMKTASELLHKGRYGLFLRMILFSGFIFSLTLEVTQEYKIATMVVSLFLFFIFGEKQAQNIQNRMRLLLQLSEFNDDFETEEIAREIK